MNPHSIHTLKSHTKTLKLHTGGRRDAGEYGLSILTRKGLLLRGWAGMVKPTGSSSLEQFPGIAIFQPLETTQAPPEAQERLGEVSEERI